MEVRTHRGSGPLQQVIEIGPHRLLAAALAACTTGKIDITTESN